MTKRLPILAALALTSCSGDAPTAENAVANAAVEQPPGQCRPPTLALADGSPLDTEMQEEAKANFAAAFKSACAKGVLAARPLVDSEATDQSTLYLVNAPEANAASIYRSEVDGDRMVLEYPFLTTDGKSQVPSEGELEEAIYCKVVGATPEEQESTGRCLVD